MKTRTGFVSNSSSSSFVLYGTTMELSEAVEKIVTVYPEILIGKNITKDTWSTPAEIMKFLNDKGVEIDYCTNEEGHVKIGLMSDPEHFTVEQLKNGVFTKEQFKNVDAFFKDLGITPYVDGGEWYC